MRWEEREMELGRPGNNRVQKKRKAESQDNERLSKRLSLLNLERNGQKLYVPVEAPSSSASLITTKPRTPPRSARMTTVLQDDTMQLDDTKHKVYIYDLDAELSDSETSDDGKLVFLPDISKHLRETRIPPSVLANSDGELAGMSQELVLYNVPSSLSVPEAQDNVRKAILETRARMRAKQDGQVEDRKPCAGAETAAGGPVWRNMNGSSPGGLGGPSDVVPIVPSIPEPLEEDDSDAMDLG